jgi:type VI secretion system secreted protein Hcp
MALDMFLQIGDVKGETKDASHKDEIDVLAWSWGVSQSGTMHQGSGGGSGKSSLQDLSFTKYIDKSTPLLWLACCNGKHFETAKLTVRKAGDNPLEYVVINLEGVLISSVSTGGSGGDDRLTENVTLNFARLKLEYVEQAATGGKSGGPVKMGWDIPQNKKI